MIPPWEIGKIGGDQGPAPMLPGPPAAPTRAAEGPPEGTASLARVEPQELAERAQAGAGGLLVPVEALARLATMLSNRGHKA